MKPTVLPRQRLDSRKETVEVMLEDVFEDAGRDCHTNIRMSAGSMLYHQGPDVFRIGFSKVAKGDRCVPTRVVGPGIKITINRAE